MRALAAMGLTNEGAFFYNMEQGTLADLVAMQRFLSEELEKKFAVQRELVIQAALQEASSPIVTPGSGGVQ